MPTTTPPSPFPPPQRPYPALFLTSRGEMRSGELGFGKYAVPHPLPGGGEASHLGAINSRAGIENVYSKGAGTNRKKARRDLAEDPRDKKGGSACSTVAVAHGGPNRARSANSRVKPWGSELVVKRIGHGGAASEQLGQVKKEWGNTASTRQRADCQASALLLHG